MDADDIDDEREDDAREQDADQTRVGEDVADDLDEAHEPEELLADEHEHDAAHREPDVAVEERARERAGVDDVEPGERDRPREDDPSDLADGPG